MKDTHQRRQGKGSFDLIEEATHRLRTAPVATLAVYYLGAIPFVLGVLYFWADMSGSPFAGQHLVDSALGMATLFVWMKFWQVIFTRRLRAQVAAGRAPRWSARRCGRMFLTQAIVQPTGLFVLPLSFVPILPAAWVYAFYQNATVLDDGGPAGTWPLLKKSWKEAMLWPRQNHGALAILSGFGLYVFLNWVVACLLLPHLIKMLFGIESVFTQSAFSMLNTTFFAGMLGLTYLCVDPILKTVYVLRCFYGESLESGEDLRAELNSVAIGSQPMAALVSLLVGLFCVLPVWAADTSGSVAPPARAAVSLPVPPAELERAIDQTIHEKKYTWRMPRGKTVESGTQEGMVGRFLHKVGAKLRDWVRDSSDWLRKWLRGLFGRPRHDPNSGASGYGWIECLQILLCALVAAVVAALAVLLYRVLRDRRSPAVVANEPIEPVPDINEENVDAGLLPGDSWMKLARELLERGELRLALRAFYFASLSHLAARNLIKIAPFKSNRDYQRELCRRGHSLPDLLSAFGDNLGSFERTWYGPHEVDRELVDRFASNVERMKAAG